jgi:hypothetical protein
LYSVALNHAGGTPEHRADFIRAIVRMLKDHITDPNVAHTASLCHFLATFGDLNLHNSPLDSIIKHRSQRLLQMNGIDLLDYEGICSSRAVHDKLRLMNELIIKSDRLTHLRFAEYDDEEFDRLLSVVSKAIEKYDGSQIANPDFWSDIIRWILLTRSCTIIFTSAMTHKAEKQGCDTMKLERNFLICLH